MLRCVENADVNTLERDHKKLQVHGLDLHSFSHIYHKLNLTPWMGCHVIKHLQSPTLHITTHFLSYDPPFQTTLNTLYHKSYCR